MAFLKNTVSGVEIPSSSLADIAFLLLVFFLVCTVIDVDKGLKLVLPAYEETLPVNPDDLLKILINDQNEILLDGELVTLTDLHFILLEKIKQNNKLIVSIKPSRKAQYQVYMGLLDQLKSLNLTRISLADPDE